MKQLLTGNEAVARGAYEAGCSAGTGYPGTPGTEIIENLAQYPGIDCEWSTNEKVALEVAFGASIAGCRTIAAMKHVGLNVAADPLFTIAYEGVNGGLVIVSADDPGPHSSQNEQDNRNYARHAKIIMLEPSDSQECLDFTRLAFELSERFDMPVLLRLTTRVCHGKTLVAIGEPVQAVIRDYIKDTAKYVPMPQNALRLHRKLEEKLLNLAAYAETSPLNRTEGAGRQTGIITSGISYQYAREIMGENAAFLKLGLTFPLPEKLIRQFAAGVGELFIVEENDAYLENQVKALGIVCQGKSLLPRCGELNAGLVGQALQPGRQRLFDTLEMALPARLPVLCPGCPHRGIFYALAQFEDLVVTNDIGCYTLGLTQPLPVTDTCVCMGGGITVGLGFAKANALAGRQTKVIGVVGDSTFFHSGMTGLVNAVYNGSKIALLILDNQSTAMTGHQENPGSGRTLRHAPARKISIEALVRACGVDDDHLRLVDPLDLTATTQALQEAYLADELFVIIALRSCILSQGETGKAKNRRNVEHSRNVGQNLLPYAVHADICCACGACTGIGCPALSRSSGLASIDPAVCGGCGFCSQVCQFGAIVKAGEPI